MAEPSTRAKWRAPRSARVSTLKKCLTAPTLSETPWFRHLPCSSCRFSEHSATREDELVAVLVLIRMFVAPLPVFRLFVSLQLGKFPMCFVLSLLPGLVGTAFVVVPGMTILMVAVVVSVVGAVLLLILGLDAHGRNQGRTQQKRT